MMPLPNHIIGDSGKIFHGSVILGVTFIVLAIWFLTIILLIIIASVKQKKKGSLDRDFPARRLLVALVFLPLASAFLWEGIYVLSKKVIITQEGFIYSSLLEKDKLLKWSEISNMEGNFPPGGSLGPGKGRYAWVKFTTHNGTIKYFSLRFISGVPKIGDIIAQKVNVTRKNSYWRAHSSRVVKDTPNPLPLNLKLFLIILKIRKIVRF